MPGFWEQLQQYAQQDQMRQANAQARQFEVAKMMSDAANSDMQNAQAYGSMEQQGINMQSGLMQAIFEARQGDRTSNNNLANSQYDRNLTREEGALNRSNAISVAQTKANVDMETFQVQLLLQQIAEKESRLAELKSKGTPNKGIPKGY